MRVKNAKRMAGTWKNALRWGRRSFDGTGLSFFHSLDRTVMRLGGPSPMRSYRDLTDANEK